MNIVYFYNLVFLNLYFLLFYVVFIFVFYVVFNGNYNNDMCCLL